MSETKIEYASHTWNPWIGCTPISRGCDNCWARHQEDGRFRRFGRCLKHHKNLDLTEMVGKHNGKRPLITRFPPKGEPYFSRGPVYQGDEVLMRPLHWRKRRTIFVGSRTDIFHEDIPFTEIMRVYGVMHRAAWHTYLVLTKRADRMLQFYQALEADWGAVTTRFRHVWPGVTVEGQAEAWRVAKLMQCPAAVRWVSHEPALGPVDWEGYMPGHSDECETAERDNDRIEDPRCTRCGEWWEQGTEEAHECPPGFGPTIDWLVTGGESGKHARPMRPDVARQDRDQCAAAGVPFFFKQWGEWSPCTLFDENPWPYGKGRFGSWYEPTACCPNSMRGWRHTKVRNAKTVVARVGKKNAGRILDGRTHDAMPQQAKERGHENNGD